MKQPKVHCAHAEMVPPADLKPHPKNPNTHPFGQIRLLTAMIRTHGWRTAVTVSKRSGCVVRGHARLQAALDGKFKAVPVDYQEYATEEEEWADLLGDNRVAELSLLDDERTRDLLVMLKDRKAVEFSGYTAAEAEAYISAASPGRPPKVDLEGETAEATRVIILFDSQEELEAFLGEFDQKPDPRRQIWPWSRLTSSGGSDSVAH